jgi:hypothetical protein
VERAILPETKGEGRADKAAGIDGSRERSKNLTFDPELGDSRGLPRAEESRSAEEERIAKGRKGAPFPCTSRVSLSLSLSLSRFSIG